MQIKQYSCLGQVYSKNSICRKYSIAVALVIIVFAVKNVGASPVEDNSSDGSISEKRLEDGKALFAAAKVLYNEKKYETALKEFEDAYELLDGYSKRFVILYNIGKCHEQLGRFESAGKHFKMYLDAAGPDATDRADVEKALEKLEKKATSVNEEFADGKAHVVQGKEFFGNQNYSAALAEFEKAHELLEGHPMRAFVLFNVGRCYEKLFRYHQALEYYKKYLDEAGPEAEDRATVKATLQALESLLGKLVIQTNVEVEVWVGDSMMGNAPGEVMVPGGRHTIELRATGYEVVKAEIQITARESQEHTFELEELSEYEGLGKGLFWTGTALTLASLGTGIVFGSVAMKKDRDGNDQHNNLNQEELSDKIDKLSLTADIMYGTAAVFAIGTTIIFFLTDWGKSEKKPDASEELHTVIMPVISEGSAGFVVQGRF